MARLPNSLANYDSTRIKIRVIDLISSYKDDGYSLLRNNNIKS